MMTNTTVIDTTLRELRGVTDLPMSAGDVARYAAIAHALGDAIIGTAPISDTSDEELIAALDGLDISVAARAELPGTAERALGVLRGRPGAGVDILVPASVFLMEYKAGVKADALEKAVSESVKLFADAGVPIRVTFEDRERGEEDFIAAVTKTALAAGAEVTDADNTVFRSSAGAVRAALSPLPAEGPARADSADNPEYRLFEYVITSGNTIQPTASVTLGRRTGKTVRTRYGDGPIDAAFGAINKALAKDCGMRVRELTDRLELTDFRIVSDGSGADAIGSASVTLRYDSRAADGGAAESGKIASYSGFGRDEDIIAAALRAYIDAVNKIAAAGELVFGGRV
ncbi:MAG: hypothetical protein LBS51_02385 [Oscillospiraceae bacterium]|jgi:hypothetical protein|nr:hypothetical protein [Oscillospiraceae bacterium]